MGIPAPTLAAAYVIAVEVIGGIALIVGVLTPVAGALNMVSLLGAIVLVHVENGVFVENGGFELVLALFAGLAVIALLGAGKFSIDGVIGRTAAATRRGHGHPDPPRRSARTRSATVSGTCWTRCGRP